MTLLDPRQGAAAIVFLVAYTFLSALCIYTLFARRPLKRFIGPAIFCILRVGANIAALGWSINLYSNFDWLVAFLVLGTEGYFFLILAVGFAIIAYEKKTFGNSVMEPRAPAASTRWQKINHRSKTPMGIFEFLLIAPNVLVVIGGSSITNGLQDFTSQDYLAASTETLENNPDIKKGKTLRTAGQALFALGIFLIYAYLFWVINKTRKRDGDKKPLLLLAATMPFMLVRSAYGILASASFEWSYYNPYAYGEDGLLEKQLVGEIVMGNLTEILAVMLIIHASFFLTQPEATYVKPTKTSNALHVQLQTMESPPLNGAEAKDTAV